MKQFILILLVCVSQLLFAREIKEYNNGTLKIEFEGKEIKNITQVGDLPLEYKQVSKNRGILTVNLDYKRVSEVFLEDLGDDFLIADHKTYVSFDGRNLGFKEDGKSIVYYPNGKIKSERYYKDGKNLSLKEYQENGSLVREVKVENNDYFLYDYFPEYTVKEKIYFMNFQARKTSEIEYHCIVPFEVYDKDSKKRIEITKTSETYYHSKYAYKVYGPKGELQLEATISSPSISETTPEEFYDQFILYSENGKELYHSTRKKLGKKWQSQYWDGNEIKTKKMTSEEIDEIWKKYKDFYFTIPNSSVRPV